MQKNLTTQRYPTPTEALSLKCLSDWIEDYLYMAFPEDPPEWVCTMDGHGAMLSGSGALVSELIPAESRAVRVLCALRHGSSEGRIMEVQLVTQSMRGVKMSFQLIAMIKTFANFQSAAIQAASLGYWLTEWLVEGDEPLLLCCFRALNERVGARWRLSSGDTANAFPEGVRIDHSVGEARVVDVASGETVWSHSRETGWSGYGAHVANELAKMLGSLGGGKLVSTARRCA